MRNSETTNTNIKVNNSEDNPTDENVINESIFNDSMFETAGDSTSAVNYDNSNEALQNEVSNINVLSNRNDCTTAENNEINEEVMIAVKYIPNLVANKVAKSDDAEIRNFQSESSHSETTNTNK